MVEQAEMFDSKPLPTGQCAQVLEWIRANGAITPEDAWDNLGCQRLAARIHDLVNRHGYPIVMTKKGGRTFYEMK